MTDGMISISLETIKRKAELRPPGYIQDCMAAGNVAGEFILFTDRAWRNLCHKYRKPLPRLTDMIANFTTSMRDWLEAGFAIVSRTQFMDRHSICIKCDNWAGNKCSLCGCYEWKPWLFSAKCPADLWPPVH